MTSSLGGSAAGVSSHATAGPLPLGTPLRFSLSLSLIRRRRRPGSAALRGYGLLGRRHDERPPFGGLVLCGVADGHIQERAATAGAHIRLHIVRLEPFSAREGVVMFQVGHQLVKCL